jgi:hypothetical protein
VPQRLGLSFADERCCSRPIAPWRPTCLRETFEYLGNRSLVCTEALIDNSLGLNNCWTLSQRLRTSRKRSRHAPSIPGPIRYRCCWRTSCVRPSVCLVESAANASLSGVEDVTTMFQLVEHDIEQHFASVPVRHVGTLDKASALNFSRPSLLPKIWDQWSDTISPG